MRHNPLEWVSNILNVMMFFALSSIGLPLPSSKPFRISGHWNSGKILEMSASSSSSPLSIHCNTETAVISFVHEAIHIVESSDTGVVKREDLGSTDCVPEHLEYVIPIFTACQNLEALLLRVT